MAGLSKSLIEVGISMVLRDQFSTNAGKISSAYAGMMNDMNTWNRGIQMQAGNAFEYGKQIVGGMYQAYEHSAGVFNQVFMTSKIAGATAKQQTELMKLAQEINLQTPLTNMDITSGMKYLAMAGNSVDQIKGMIGPAARLASIFDMALGGKGGTADLMTNIMSTFHLVASESDDVADILGRATTSANMNLTDLAQSLEYSGATFRNAGVDLASAAASIGVLGNQGIQGSGAGTALANMYRYLTLSITGQRTKGAAALKALGIDRNSLIDSQGQLKRVDKIISILKSRMQGLSGISKEAIEYNLVGVRGSRSLSALMDGSEQLTRIMESIEKTRQGFTIDTINDKLKTSEGIINTLTSSIDNLKTNLGNSLSEVLDPMTKFISYIINGLSSFAGTTAGNLLIKFSAISVTVGLIVNGFRLAARFISMIHNGIILAQGAMRGMATSTTTVNTQAAMLETHLRTIVALMMQYTAMAMAPGTSMVLPGGGKLGKGKTGTIYSTIHGRKGRGGTAWYAENYGASMKPTPGGSPARGNGVNRGKLGTLGGLVGSSLMMFGGPWGMAAGIGITALSYILSNNSDSVSENTKAVEKNTSQMSAEEFRAKYEEKFINAMKAAIKEGNKEPMKLSISIDGQPYMPHHDGDILNIDTWGTY